MKSQSFGIHWFRRDLRMAGNQALLENFKKHDGRVVGIFWFDSKFLSRSDFSPHRFAFFLKSLRALKNELKAAGGDLIVLDELPTLGFPKLIQFLKGSREFAIQTISFSRDYEPFARERDHKIKFCLTNELNLEVLTERDHLFIEPHEITKSVTPSENNYYQVYSPFAKKWFKLMKSPEILQRVNRQQRGFSYLENLRENKTLFKLSWRSLLSNNDEFKDRLDLFETNNSKNVSIEIPEAGSFVAFEKLKAFKQKIQNYADTRNFPEADGTSQFSIYLKNGSLNSSQIISYLNLYECDYASESGETKFLKEIVWREFYYSILYHVPRVENEAFLEKFKNLSWQNNIKYFKAWCEGRTGFPIVDAGMRQLNTTGWMHNRVRMIVASFLTKDLLIDWRWGENYFMKMLLDGDLAPNNGGWQWAASTGCDPQPYFRIFNPLLQSQKFDPDGNYIRKYVPELKHLDSKTIHAPHTFGLVKDYPDPIVDHAAQKLKALAMYRN